MRLSKMMLATTVFCMTTLTVMPIMVMRVSDGDDDEDDDWDVFFAENVDNDVGA